jgi:hypothetical protein
MNAYIGAFAHPFYAVTGPDGKFTISGLDAGTYEITAWHERLGTQKASVTVGATGSKTQDFKFAMPPRNSDPEISRMSETRRLSPHTSPTTRTPTAHHESWASGASTSSPSTTRSSASSTASPACCSSSSASR